MTTNFITISNSSRANLEAFFDGLASTVGLAPELLFDTNGLTFSSGRLDQVSLRMSVASARLGAGHSLSLSIDGVQLRSDVTANGATLTLQPGILTGHILFDGVQLATFTLDNRDADVLAISHAVNGVQGLSLKLDSVMARILNGTDDALHLGNLSAVDVTGLASVVFRAAIADKTPAQLLDWAKSLVTLPANLDTVGELAHFVQQIFTQPQLASLTFDELKAFVQSGVLGTNSLTPLLLSTLSFMAGTAPNANLSDALTAIQAKPALAGLTISSLASGVSQQTFDALVASGLNPATLQSLLSQLKTAAQSMTLESVFDDLVGGALQLLAASNMSITDVLLRVVASFDTQAALDAALAAVDLTPLGLNRDWVTNILNRIHSSGSVDLASLLPIAAKTFLAYDGSVRFEILDAAGLGILSNGKLINEASVTLPLTNASTQTVPLVYGVVGNDLPQAQPAAVSVPEGGSISGVVQAFDPDPGDALRFALLDPLHRPAGLTFNSDGQWFFDGTAYDLPAGQQRVINVGFTVTDAGGLSSSSVLSITVNGVNDPPVGSVFISGEAVVGGTLTAGNTIGDLDGLGSITYSWYAGNRLLGQGNTYHLLPADAGAAIHVVASYYDGGTHEQVASGNTPLVLEPPPQEFAVAGMVYHWKNHALLSGVALTLGGSDPAAVNPAYDLRNVAVDASGQVSVEIWGQATGNVANLNLHLGFAPGIGASFVLNQAAMQGWAVTRSDASDSIDIAAISPGNPVTGQFKLGTLSLGAVGAIDTVLTVSGLLGAQQVGYQASFGSTATDSDRHYVFGSIESGGYGLLAYKPLGTGENGSVINSADALAALRLAVGSSLYDDPDGSGPLKAQAVSPYQFIAADVNEDGRVTAADALAILKMAVKRADAPAREWLFVSESADFWDEQLSVFTINRNSVAWEHDRIVVELDGADLTQNLVAVLKGDVNGSWSVPAGSTVLPNSYFVELVGVDVEQAQQWGIVNG